MARKPVAKPTRAVRPSNTSRAAGAPAPTSAAATAPMEGARQSSGFYDPDSGVAERTASPLESAFTQTIRERHIPLETGGSADVEIAEHLAAEATSNPDDLAAEIARIRKFRKPVGALNQKLALPERSGYKRHWFNDVAGRIGEAEANGWRHVQDKDGKSISRAVGTGRDKGALYAFAMEIPLVFWQEDQDAKHKLAADTLAGLKASPFKSAPGVAKPSDKGKFYDPEETTGTGPLQIVKG